VLLFLGGLPILAHGVLNVNRKIFWLQTQTFEFWYMLLMISHGAGSLMFLMDFDERTIVVGWALVQFTMLVCDSSLEEVNIRVLRMFLIESVIYSVMIPYFIIYGMIKVKNIEFEVRLPKAEIRFQLNYLALVVSAFVTFFFFFLKWLFNGLKHPQYFVFLDAKVCRPENFSLSRYLQQQGQ